MFTGIVEEVGCIRMLTMAAAVQRISIGCDKILVDVHTGDSIAVNGVCLTVAEYGEGYFTADVMNETFRRTDLGGLRIGNKVNLERALPANGRFGGHIVSGHIDGTGVIKSVRRDGNAYWFEIGSTGEILNGIVEKGSVAIDGISLTVASTGSVSFKVSVIPHTLENTVLGLKKVGDRVNLENDIIGKYIRKYTQCPGGGSLSREFLIANGF